MDMLGHVLAMHWTCRVGALKTWKPNLPKFLRPEAGLMSDFKISPVSPLVAIQHLSLAINLH